MKSATLAQPAGFASARRVTVWCSYFAKIATAAAVVLVIAGFGSLQAAPLPGAIFTTDIGRSVNVNIYESKDDVYLNGGPRHPGAAGLPDGYYYVKVTTPDGIPLGSSVNLGDGTPVHVTNGEFDFSYPLSSILQKETDGSIGYDDTTNNGGEYKVWVSTQSTFPTDSSKTDNFKVKRGSGSLHGTVVVSKFYDTNTNGAQDSGEPCLGGWQFTITPCDKSGDPLMDSEGNPLTSLVKYTYQTVPKFSITLEAGYYLVEESQPGETNWRPTTDTAFVANVVNGGTVYVTFGNVALGAGGGLTLGFWSNKNGQALFVEGNDIALMRALNLRDGAGAHFDPANYNGTPASTAFRPWLLGATAANMAYMLSAQLAAMELNVLNLKVSGTSMLYAVGTKNANAVGFSTVNDLRNEANTELVTNSLVLSGHPFRAYQEVLKNTLDAGNNNLNFVLPAVPTPAFTFNP